MPRYVRLIFYLTLVSLSISGLTIVKPVYAIVADHTVVSQFSSTPRTTIEAAQAKKLLYYHQSTGNNIQYFGLNCLAGTEYDTAIRPECQTYINNRTNNIWPYYAYPNWTWILWPEPMADAISKMNQFVNLVNQQMTQDPNRYQIFGMKFCYVDGYNLNFNDYRTKMENLESAYPTKTFIWATDVLNTGNHINNPTIQAFNNSVRSYAQSHTNKPFLDLADIESKGGSCRDSQGFEVLCPDYYNDAGGDAGGHPDIDGSIAMAKGLWWLMAYISGSGITTTPNPTTPVTPTPTPTSRPLNSPTPTPQPTAIPPGSSVNIAPTGTGYRWWQNTSALSNTNSAPAQGINDNNTTVDVKLTTNGVDDQSNAYEAAGVIWTLNQNNIERVDFINGSFDANQNGVFSANLQMQYTMDGSTWTVSSWPFTPLYAYDQASAANQTYSFVGPPISNIRGIRIVGQVHTSSSGGSWQAYIKELLVYTGSSITPTQTPTSAPVPGDANGDRKVDELDYAIWLAHYNPGVTQSGGTSIGDFNSDSRVNGLDYVIWLNNYGV